MRTGGRWARPYEGEAWKYIIPCDVATGEEAWRCDLPSIEFHPVMNVPYACGSFYSAATGELLDMVVYGAPMISCAPPIIAREPMREIKAGEPTRPGA